MLKLGSSGFNFKDSAACFNSKLKTYFGVAVSSNLSSSILGSAKLIYVSTSGWMISTLSFKSKSMMVKKNPPSFIFSLFSTANPKLVPSLLKDRLPFTVSISMSISDPGPI